MKLIQLTILIVLTALGGQSLQAATAIIESLSGSPKIFEIGETGAREVSLPREGAAYRLPIEVETGPGDSALFRLPDSKVSVAPNSIMRINSPETRESGLFQRILQKAGTSFFSVDRRTVEHFEVQTPYLTSVVKGTVFNVVVHESGATVALHEGRLLVTSPDGLQSVDLRPGDVAFSTESGEVRKLGRNMAGRSTSLGAGSAVAATEGNRAIETAIASTTDERNQSTLEDLARVDSVATELTLPDTGIADTLSDATGALDLNTDDVVPQLADSASGIVADLGGATGDLVSDLGGTTGDLVGDLGGTTGDLVSGVGAGAGDLVADIGTTAGDLTGGLAPPVGDLLSDVGDVSGGLIADTGGTSGDLLADVGDVSGDLAADLGGAGGDLLGEVGGATGDLLGDSGGATGDLLGDSGGASGDLLADLGGATGDLLGDTGADNLDTTVEDALEELDLDDGLEDLGGALRGLFP